MEGAKFEWAYRVKSVSHPTEPANTGNSTTTGSKERIEI